MKPNSPDGQQKKPDILVVDDTPANLHLLAVMLKDHGYRVRPVPSGALAIQAIHNEKPDLILLDINMPEMNGYEVCRRLKADEAMKDIPILFISALDETIDKVKAFAAGGVDYVTKPFQFAEVEARVETHLKLRHLQLEMERQHSRLRATNDQLRKLEALRDNLIHMVVHDMRSPLMGVAGSLEILEMGAGKKLSTDELGILKNARSSGKILIGMVNSLLDVNRLEQGQMPLTPAKEDPDILIQNAIQSLGSLPHPGSLLHRKQPRPASVNCDARLVTRIIANLVGNAIKNTPPGGSITVSSESNETGTKISVEDTGRGIPHEFHGIIFEKFAQVGGTPNGNGCSTGLGLTFCKLAVEAHGGTIGVESEVDKGSTFWFTLPA